MRGAVLVTLVSIVAIAVVMPPAITLVLNTFTRLAHFIS